MRDRDEGSQRNVAMGERQRAIEAARDRCHCFAMTARSRRTAD